MAVVMEIISFLENSDAYCSFWKAPQVQQGVQRGVSGCPITPLESICRQRAKLDVKLPITSSQSDKYANPADVWHLGERGEKPKVRRAIVPWGFLVCVARQHGVERLNNICI